MVRIEKEWTQYDCEGRGFGVVTGYEEISEDMYDLCISERKKR